MTAITTHGAILDGLHAAQREAVAHAGGPLLIIAGAGTGKTTVITHRIAHLIASKRARPDQILALTFTEKAAREMEERVDRLVPYGYVDTWISTFHAFGDRVLREQAVRLGLSSGVQVLSKVQQTVFLEQRLFDLPFDQLRPPQQPTKHIEALAALFSRAKDEDITPEEYVRYAEAQCATVAADDAAAVATARRQLEIAHLYAAYQTLLRKHDRLDFGDQIALTLALFRAHPDVVARYRAQYPWILVDEFQDTNYAQFELVKLLAPGAAELTIVADDDQSIYKFRGAAISNILNFLHAYPQAKEVVISENFRSRQPILDAAYRLIRYNDPERLEVQRGIDKRLVSMREGADEAPAFRCFDTVASESQWVAEQIRDLVTAGRYRYRDCAILVRSNKDAEPFLETLSYLGLPWQFPGMAGLALRAEVRLLLAILRMLADPEDSLSWFYVASSELYRVPMDDLTACNRAAQRSHRSLRHVFQQRASLDLQLSPAGEERIAQLLRDVEEWVKLSRDLSPGQLLYRVLTEASTGNYLQALTHPECADQLRSVAAFFSRLHDIESQMRYSRLAELMSHAAWLEQLTEDPSSNEVTWDADAVQVLTVHRAKGLEFPIVFMVGLVQGRFPVPSRRDALELPEPLIKDILPSGEVHLQEERRLFYVGMTRAKDQLLLTAAFNYGGKSTRKVSQFVLEALELPPPEPPTRTAPLDVIRRAQRKPVPQPAREPVAGEPLKLDPHGVDDYLTCPLKYRFSHILRVPILRHHLVIYGAALHAAIEQFLRAKQDGRVMPLEELWQHFESAWSNEGFLTRGHEEMRLAQGKEVLRAFWKREQTSSTVPTLIEEKFKCLLTPEQIHLVGRWDRVDCIDGSVTLLDYKSSDVREPKEAQKRVQESVQMAAYALAWSLLHGQPPDHVQLHFVDSGLVGDTTFTPEDLSAIRERIAQAADGIRRGEFPAKPEVHRCRWCAYQAICPSAPRERT